MKPKRTPKIKEHSHAGVLRAKISQKLAGSKRSTSFLSPQDCTPRPDQRHVSYLPAPQRGVKRSILPVNLLIHGSRGSLKADLSGIGVKLHQQAFAFRMPDDSLAGMNIRIGDIAIIEPCLWHLKEGDLLLVNVDGIETLKRVTFCGNLMYFRADDSSNQPLLAAWQYAFSGVVTGILRVFMRTDLVSPKPESISVDTRASVKKPPRCHQGLDKTPARNVLSDDPPKPGTLGRYIG